MNVMGTKDLEEQVVILMSRSTNKKSNVPQNKQRKQLTEGNVVETLRLKEFVVYRSQRTSGVSRIGLPQQLPPELLEKFDYAYGVFTLEEQEQIELVAREVRPRFFRERFGSNGDPARNCRGRLQLPVKHVLRRHGYPPEK